MVEKSKLIQSIKEHNNTVYLTIGFRWKCPTTMDKPMTVKQAIEFVNNSNYFMELNKRDGKLYLQCYTANDMW